MIFLFCCIFSSKNSAKKHAGLFLPISQFPIYQFPNQRDTPLKLNGLEAFYPKFMLKNQSYFCLWPKTSQNVNFFYEKLLFHAKFVHNFREKHWKFAKTHTSYLKLKKFLKKLKEFLKKLKKFCPKTQPSRLAHSSKKCPKKSLQSSRLRKCPKSPGNLGTASLV